MFDLPRRFLVLALPLFWCASLIAFRMLWFGTRGYGFLGWNLILAGVPVVAGTLFLRAPTGRTGTLFGSAAFAVWLLFLPNAFYVVTDFMHLGPRPPVPFWYDIALVTSAACTGLVLGYRALGDVHHELARRTNPSLAWGVVVVTSFLCGFGVYLGRFQRWNSWDVLSHPFGVASQLADRITDPFAHPRTLGVTLVYGGALLVGYLAVRALAPDSPERTAFR